MVYGACPGAREALDAALAQDQLLSGQEQMLRKPCV
jgi:hypothetical protein